MENVSYAVCPNPACGKTIKINCSAEIAAKRAMICPNCKTRFAIKNQLINAEGSPKPHAEEQTGQKTNQDAEEPGYLFQNGVVLIRESDGYPYLFFNSKTTFGRYDITMQSDVLTSTTDIAISRKHVLIKMEPCDKGKRVSLTNLTNGRCQVGQTELAQDQSVQLSDGDYIKLGNTMFSIRDINKNDI